MKNPPPGRVQSTPSGIWVAYKRLEHSVAPLAIDLTEVLYVGLQVTLLAICGQDVGHKWVAEPPPIQRSPLPISRATSPAGPMIQPMRTAGAR